MPDTDINPKPDRPADEELSGEGSVPEHVKDQAEAAYFAQLFVDALGDPEHAPAGWWHLKLWKGP